MPVTVEEILKTVHTILEDKKAQDIVTIDLRNRTAITDYMVIATGQSGRQLAAMAEHISVALKQLGLRVGVEGLPHAEWVLLDAGDVIVHLFRPETRAFYNLEKMWQADMPPVV